MTWGGTMAVTIRCMMVAASMLGSREYGEEGGDDEDMEDGDDYTDGDHVDEEDSVCGTDFECDSEREDDKIWRRALRKELNKTLPEELVAMLMFTFSTDALGDALCDSEDLHRKKGPQSREWEDHLEHLRREAQRRSSEMLG